MFENRVFRANATLGVIDFISSDQVSWKFKKVEIIKSKEPRKDKAQITSRSLKF